MQFGIDDKYLHSSAKLAVSNYLAVAHMLNIFEWIAFDILSLLKQVLLFRSGLRIFSASRQDKKLLSVLQVLTFMADSEASSSNIVLSGNAKFSFLSIKDTCGKDQNSKAMVIHSTSQIPVCTGNLYICTSHVLALKF